jgi:protein TonB
MEKIGRLKLCAGLALLFHGSLLLGGVLGLGSQPEYGMQGAVAGGGGQPKAVAPPPDDIVDLIQDDEDAPAEHAQRSRPQAVVTPAASAAAPGPASSGAQALPSYFRNPPPRYPEAARRAKQEGLVLLRVAVDASGKVSSVSLLNSSGFPLLDAAAQQGVSDWRFKPAQVAGIGIASNVNVPVQFRLRDARP